MLRSVVVTVLLSVSLCVPAAEKTILILGDSLSAAYGMNAQAGWVSLLRARMNRAGYHYEIINASVSGDTTHGAHTRLDAILKEIRPDITIVELGGNDGLRGISLGEIRTNLSAIVEKLAAVDSRILLVEMLLPPNYGGAYIEKFVGIYKTLGVQDNVTLGRMLPDTIAEDPTLMQDDGIHPTAAAQPLMLELLWPYLHPLLDQNNNS
ncbi:MAG: arylesterase [Gammaproteobacteria bacterium]|nr:arylesterase [Gammaproteobacteria bacterium]MCY4211399.1 arylesterase [Gammaproteobacteria bacterium]MCY4338043.1 arylesterase [Gammaproteobacteria bacterium]